MAGTKWKKAKAALALNLCVHVPRTLEDERESLPSLPSHHYQYVESIQSNGSGGGGGGGGGRAESHSLPLSSSRKSSEAFPAATTATPSPPHPVAAKHSSHRSLSGGLRLSKTGSRSSKNICAICLGTMKPGLGHAIFTAECSHAFHFNCIASNVKHGNQVCPVCRAVWKEVPFQGPSPLHGKTKFHVGWPAEEALITELHGLSHRNNGHRHITPLLSITEPAVFNDDELLDHHTDMVNRAPFARDGINNNTTGPMDINLYPEVSAVQRSISQENFSVLIHLKAPVKSSQCNLGQSQANVSPNLQSSRAPVDLVTVLDVSGSMAGTKLALLKRAMGFVIQNLGPSDRISVIAFSSTARRLFPLIRMTDSGRQQALQAVNSLVSNGGTNIAEGLRKGAKVMEERREKNPVGSIILLSDGQDTYSVSCYDRGNKRPDYQSLLPFSVRGGTNTGIQVPVHAFGFGADHDAASMHSISEASGGTFSFIEAEGVIQDAFAQCIGGLLSVVVQDLRVDIECVHPDIRLGPLQAGSYSTQVANDARTGFINIGDLYADEARDFLVSVNVPVGGASNETTLLKVRGVYKDPVSKESLTLDSREIKIQRPEVVREQVVSIEVDRQRNRVRAAAAMAEAQDSAERGDLPSAVFILDSFRRVLSETTSARAGDQLCVALDAELKEMQDRMATRRTYEVSGRAYVLSGLSSHSWQRATARGDSTDSTSLVHAYQTPSMVDMVSRSQILGSPSSQPSLWPGRLGPVQPQPR